MGRPSNKLMIGIVGPLASGKGEVAEYLRGQFGFVSFTLSHLVHEELERRGVKSLLGKIYRTWGMSSEKSLVIRY